MEIKESEIWSKDKMDKVKEFISERSKNQSFKRKLKNKWLSLKYRFL